MPKRFEYLIELDDEQLLKLRDDTQSDIDYYYDTLDDDEADSLEKSEIRNSDLPLARDLLAAIDELIRIRGIEPRSR